MTRLAGKTGFVLLLAISIFLACKKEYSCENCIPDSNPDIPVNHAPHAIAGSDQIIRLPVNEVNLDGSLSTDPDGNILSYSWIILSGQSPLMFFSNANAAQTIVGNLIVGIYQFELTVNDAAGLTSMDTVEIIVNPAPVDSRWSRIEGIYRFDFANNILSSFDENLLLGIRDELYAISMKGELWRYPWTKIGPLPGFATNIAVSVVFGIEDRGYFIGAGLSWEYDLVTREITKKTNVPLGDDRVDYSIPLVIGNKAYLVGRMNNHVTVYDPANDTYTRLKDFPGKGAVAGFLIGGYGYYLEEDGNLWKYDPAADQWEQKASLHPALFSMSGFSLDGDGYILGGIDPQGYGLIKLWQYDSGSDTWKNVNDDYPGYGINKIKTATLSTGGYAGFGYMRSDFFAADIWTYR